VSVPTTRLAPAPWLRLPRRTARLRLTLLYAGLFFLLGTAVLAIVYLLVSRTSPIAERATPVSVHVHGVAGPVPGVQIQPAGLPALLQTQHDSDLKRLLEVSWVALAVTTVASALLGWLAAGRVLRPVREITTTARTISAGNLNERLALAGPNDEFKQLGDTLDDLLGRLESSFEAQRRFVANASHELRTPLTVERTLLQVALADPNASAKKLRATCEELLATGAEQERLLESLLTLATSERGLEHRTPVDLSAVVAHVLLAPRTAIGDGGLQLTRSLASAPTSGDQALLERLVANLVDNAVEYNVTGGRIDVETGTIHRNAYVSVSNSGRVIGQVDVERLFEPFQRLDADRTANANGHHGLGLSIVRAISTAHEGTVTALPRTGGGLTVIASFPPT
jgi:signal transduction histidine kinase